MGRGRRRLVGLRLFSGILTRRIMQSHGNIFNASIWKCTMENCGLGHRLLGDTGPAGVGYCTRPDEFEFIICNLTDRKSVV